MSGRGGAPSGVGSLPPPVASAGAVAVAESTQLPRLRAAARRGGADAEATLARELLETGVDADAVEAAGWARRAAEGGHVDAMEWLSFACNKGVPGVRVNAAAGYQWAARGALAGSVVCQVNAGLALLRGIGVTQDDAAAVRWYRRAADAGNSQAKFNLFVCYLDGLGGLRADDPAGVAWLRKAAVGGLADAQEALATLMVRAGVAADKAEAVGWFCRAAEGGHVGAMEWMWKACKHGALGLPLDVAEAYRWAARGAEAGSVMCQVNAGYALLYGKGVAKDEAAAVRWYWRAADAGNTQAQFNLFLCYRDGLGGLRADDPAGVAWLRKAAEDGDVDAQAELSRCLRAGVGMPIDTAEAITWGLRAAEGGHVFSQGDMGHRLLSGMGVPTDAVAGVALLQKAVGSDDLFACVHLGNAHAAGLGGLPVDMAAALALYERAAAGEDAEQAATARRALHELSSYPTIIGRIALPTLAEPVCGYVACGAALDAGTLSGLCKGCRAVRFCGSDCQNASWATHRPACKAAVAARAAALAAAPPSSSASPPTAPSAALTAQREEMEVWRRMPLDTLRAAAESGTAAAQGVIGIAYIIGTLGLAEDAEAGLAWLRKAAAQGLLPARLPLGAAASVAAAEVGSDAATRYTEALEWYRPLAEAGDAGVLYNASVCCRRLAVVQRGDGGGAAALYAEAARWLRGAAAMGNPYALDALGAAAWDGDAELGVTADRAEARRLFVEADAAGLPETMRAKRPAGADVRGGGASQVVSATQPI